MPVDVLQHDDTVVNDPAHRNCQTGQAHEVQRPVEKRHDQHRNHHAERDGKGDYDGGPQGVGDTREGPGPQLQQEKEHGQHSESEALDALADHLAQFLFQPGRLALHYRDVNVGRNLTLQVNQQLVDGVGNVDGVAVRGFLHVQAHAGIAVGTRDGAGLGSGNTHVGHLSQADGRCVAPGSPARTGRAAVPGETHRQLAYGLQVGVVMECAHGHGAVAGSHAAGVDVHRVTLQSADYVLDGQPIGVQQNGVHRHEHLLVHGSLNLHVEHSRERL